MSLEWRGRGLRPRLRYDAGRDACETIAKQETDMGRGVQGLVLVLMTMAVGAPVLAEDRPQNPRPGTFFLVEADVGFGLGEAFAESPSGLVTGLTLGFGGKPKGWPLRFFGIMRLSWSDLRARIDDGLERSAIERAIFEWSLGLRVIAPLKDRLRFLADTALGLADIRSRASLGGGAERIGSDDSSFVVTFGLGLQYRLHYNFSLGARMELVIPTGLAPFDALAETAGASSSDAGMANLSWVLAATLHF